MKCKYTNPGENVDDGLEQVFIIIDFALEFFDFIKHKKITMQIRKNFKNFKKMNFQAESYAPIFAKYPEVRLVKYISVCVQPVKEVKTLCTMQAVNVV